MWWSPLPKKEKDRLAVPCEGRCWISVHKEEGMGFLVSSLLASFPWGNFKTQGPVHQFPVPSESFPLVEQPQVCMKHVECISSSTSGRSVVRYSFLYKLTVLIQSRVLQEQIRSQLHLSCKKTNRKESHILCILAKNLEFEVGNLLWYTACNYQG
jgi:hypothetical protein